MTRPELTELMHRESDQLDPAAGQRILQEALLKGARRRRARQLAVGASAAALVAVFVGGFSLVDSWRSDRANDGTAPVAPVGSPVMSGVVVDGSGNPVPGVEVRLTAEQPVGDAIHEIPVGMDVTDEQGAFTTYGDLPASVTARNPDGSVNVQIRMSDPAMTLYYGIQLMPPASSADPWTWTSSPDLGVVAAAERDLAAGGAADNLYLVFDPDHEVASEWSSDSTMTNPDALTPDANQ